MRIPVKDDTWLVLGPGRTGSKVIVDVIIKLAEHFTVTPELVGPTHNVDSVKLSTVYHSHKIQDLRFQQMMTKTILSTRDMVDAALSWCIQPHIKEWHLYPVKHREIIKQLEQNIPYFYLDPELFNTHYQRSKLFYQAIADYDLSKFIIIDYEEFKDSPLNILAKLDYVHVPIRGFPAKNPGSPDKWITNWDEISILIKDLERRPKKIFVK